MTYNEHMPTYRNSDLGQPTPVHALTDAAELGRQAVLDFAKANPVQLVAGKPKRIPLEPEVEAELVTKHPQPWTTHTVADLTGSPAVFGRAAVAAGRRVGVITAGDAVEVRVYGSPTIRAWWKGGRTTGVVVGREAVVPMRVAVLMLAGHKLDEARDIYEDERAEAARKRAEKKAAS